MRPSALLVALSVGTLVRASHIPKDVKRDGVSNAIDCSGEIYNKYVHVIFQSSANN